MKQAAERTPTKAFKGKSVHSLLVIVLNVVLLVAAFVLYGRYTSAYQEQLFQENLGNIANLNESSASNATALVESWNIKLEDIAQYIAHNALTHKQALTMISDANSSPDRQFELIGSDYTGYLARKGADGNFIPLSYESTSYADLRKAIDDVQDLAYGDIRFAPEFTDGETALKYFAIYKHLPLKDENGHESVYTLFLAAKSRDVLAAFNSQGDFAGQSAVLIDASGNYIVSNNDFKSDNFFQYLYVYNDLTLDQRNAIQQQVLASASGELFYRDAAGQDCVFRYAQMQTNNWYCITAVPIASFRTPAFNINFVIYAVLLLLLMLVTDVVWLRYMNRQLRVSMRREKEASEAKTDFLSRMSHDIRTPLNGIIGMTILAKDEPNPPRTAEYLESIKISGNFLLGLVNDILDMSRVESGKVTLHPEPYRSAELSTYINAVIGPLCVDKGLTLTIDTPSDEQAILLDRLRFNQVIFNLLSNAVKYTPAGGHVSLCWENTVLPDRRVALDIAVRDDGIGMSEEFQAHMFESFAQEHTDVSASTGTGLGLSIVWSLIQLMGGTIHVESHLGQGTEIRIHLVTETREAPAAVPAVNGSETLAGKRMLLCEDNEINRIVAARLLEKWDVTVDCAANGRIGVDMFRDSDIGAYDAILMDVKMPEMNGLDATRAIRLLPRDDAATVPIVAMTANAYDSDVQNCIDAGMNAHLGKPIDTAQLFAMLTKLTH